MLDPSFDHDKSTSLLTKGVNDITKGVERNKEYDQEVFCSRCFLGLLNECNFFKWRLKTNCCNPSLKLVTKVRAYKGVGQKGSPGVTSHALGSVGECKGMNFHVLK
jgi:hypothetical protein